MPRRTLRTLAVTTVAVVLIVAVAWVIVAGPPDLDVRLAAVGSAIVALWGAARGAARMLPDKDHDGIPDVLEDEEENDG